MRPDTDNLNEVSIKVTRPWLRFQWNIRVQTLSGDVIEKRGRKLLLKDAVTEAVGVVNQINQAAA